MNKLKIIVEEIGHLKLQIPLKIVFKYIITIKKYKSRNLLFY
jgi:hypothetical protein